MFKYALNWGKSVNICLIISALFFAASHQIFAVQYQQCAQNSSCSIGEFLYDDNYSPISVGTSCTLTSRYPNGNVLVNSENMTGTADGFYSYNVGTSGLVNGIYRGQMCCNTAGENICLDKTFEVAATVSTLVSDIWASPNRSLTDFGSLVSNIWTSPSSIGTSIAVLSAQISAVDTKIVTIDSKVDSLSTSISTIQSNTTNILNKWSTFSVTDIIAYIDTLETQLGTNSQICSDNSVFGHIACLSDKWGSESASTIFTAANNAYSTSVSLRSELNFAGKSTTAYDEIITLKNYIDTLESSIGSSSDLSSSTTIFGRIKQVSEAVANIDNSTLDLNDLLAKWGTYTATDIYDKITTISTQVSAINSVSNIDNITNNNITQTTDLSVLQNQVLAMRAILDVNRILLEKIDNKPIIKSWLENGSIIFKTLITNPSNVVTQDVPFSYFLSPEVKQSDIIKKSENLEIKYDTSKAILFAEGNFKLKPKETIIVEIEVNDIWSVPQSKIDTLRRQASELFVPLKNTAYFAQGVTLHSDIQASLDRIMEIQKSSKLPEDKIKDYRTAQIELESVTKKIDSLKEILTQSGSIGTLSGFIGGVQTVGVWGIIVVLVVGFVLLAIYIKSINTNDGHKPPHKPPTEYQFSVPRRSFHSGLTFASVLGLSLGISSSVTYFYATRNKAVEPSHPTVLSATIEITPTPTLQPTPTPILAPTIIEQPIEAEPTIVPTAIPTKIIPIPQISGTKAIIVPSLNSYVSVRVDSNRNSTAINRVMSGTEVMVITEKINDFGEKWLQITQDDIKGWVLGQLVQFVQNSTDSSSVSVSAKVTVNVPSHDTVYIYQKPSFNASITKKITDSEPADILLETKMWAKIILSRSNVTGWVSQDFIVKSN